MTRPAQTYVNTLVFSIISGMVSVALLLTLMLSDSLSAYMFVIVTIEIGLLLIIINAMYRVIAYERNMRNAINNASKNSFAADNCPDYYTMRFSSTGNTCANVFKGIAPGGIKYVMYYVPSAKYQLTGQGNSVVFSGNAPDDVIKIKNLESIKIDDACKIVQGKPADADTDKKEANNYTIPWTLSLIHI